MPAPAHFLLFAFLPEQEVEGRMRSWFAKFASWVAEAAGSSWAFVLAIVVVAVWALTGPIFGFSDTWQLVINTGTTIVTFLMVFLIQNTQNRDTKAMHLKLDELLRATRGARQASSPIWSTRTKKTSSTSGMRCSKNAASAPRRTSNTTAAPRRASASADNSRREHRELPCPNDRGTTIRTTAR